MTLEISSHSVSRVSLVQVVELLVTRLSMLDSSSTNKLSRSDMMRSLTGAVEELGNTDWDW